MATFIASVNHYVTASIKSSADVFVSIFELLDTYGEQIGVRRIAYSTGSFPDGKGMGYANSLDPPGNNAWACFYFYRSDNPFFAVFQHATASSPSYPFGQLTGAQGILMGNDAAARLGGVGVQFATVPFRLGRDVDIWAGSRRSDGNDSKNLPCAWLTSSDDLVVFPRANNGNNGADYSTHFSGLSPISKSAYSAIVTQADLATSSLMWHVMADSNSFLFLKNFGTSTLRYSGIWFGQYSEAVGFNSKLRYAMINHTTISNDPPFSPLSSGTWYGSRAGTSSYDGGIAHPTCQSGCFAVCLDLPPFMSSSRFSPCALYSSRSSAPLYDEFPWAIGAYDPEGQVFGFAGSTKMIRAMWGVPTHTFFSSSMRAAFGNSASGSVKLTVPWPSGTLYTPGTNLHRTGTLVIFQSTY